MSDYICDREKWLGPTVLRASSQKKLLCLQQITYQAQLNEMYTGFLPIRSVA